METEDVAVGVGGLHGSSCVVGGDAVGTGEADAADEALGVKLGGGEALGVAVMLGSGAGLLVAVRAGALGVDDAVVGGECDALGLAGGVRVGVACAVDEAELPAHERAASAIGFPFKQPVPGASAVAYAVVD